jgi:hypothetical protein
MDEYSTNIFMFVEDNYKTFIKAEDNNEVFSCPSK